MNNQTITINSSSLNLLPEEVLAKRKQSSKFTLVNRLSILSLIALAIITSSVLFLRVTQESALKEAKEKLNSNENRLKSLTTKEKDVLLLKQRLAQIQALRGGDTTTKAIFNLIVKVLPSEIEVNDIQVDKKGRVTASLGTSSLSSIENLTSSLSDKGNSEDIISKVDMDGLSLGKTGVYRFSLVIMPK